MLRKHQPLATNDFLNGFLPQQDPQRRLAHEDECALNLELNLLIDQLPTLLKSKLLRTTLDTFNSKYSTDPLIKIDPANPTEVNAAFSMLTMLVQAYIWEDNAHPAQLVPRILSENIFHLRAHHARIPVLTYADYVLYNWYRVDKKQGITLENIEPLFMFTGGEEEAWFIKIHVVIEAALSEAIAAAVDIYNLAETPYVENRRALFAEYFTRMADSIEYATEVLGRMYDKCSPSFFFNVLRPYLEGAEKANGIQFDLAEQNTTKYYYRGSSGAQSSTVPALDAILNITHANDQMTQTLHAFLDYMPKQHKELILQLKENKVELALQALSREPLPELRRAIGQLWLFRKKHMHLPVDYITRQAKMQNIPLEQVTGTGSTHIGLFLGKRTQDTLESAIKQGWNPQAKL